MELLEFILLMMAEAMGLQGMINDMIAKCDFPIGQLQFQMRKALRKFKTIKNVNTIARLISIAENRHDEFATIYFHH